MNPLKVRIDVPDDIRKPVTYIWSVYATHWQLDYEMSNQACDLTIGLTPDADIVLSTTFVQLIRNTCWDSKSWFEVQPLILHENGQPDYLGSTFYMINSLQELREDEDDYDQFGRFKVEKSYQYRFNCLQEDLVTSYFEQIRKSVPALKHRGAPRQKKVFLSHDVDCISHGIFQEAKAALRKGQVGTLLNVLAQNLLGKTSFLNMDDIMDIHDVYDLKSTFFWLVEKGKGSSPSHPGVTIPNADYNLANKSIRAAIQRVGKRGFENGLHKSVSGLSFDQELRKLDVRVSGNRNHYLLIRLPDHYNQLEQSKIDLDFSLGFGPQQGYRNSYGCPFVPFDIQKDQPYTFLEVPLQIMDTTFKFYQKLSPDQTGEKILAFIDNMKDNSVLSILWHNDMFSPVKNPEWLKLYKHILECLVSNKIRSITQQELEERRLSILSSFRNSSL